MTGPSAWFELHRWAMESEGANNLSTMGPNSPQRSNILHGRLENHPFYHCIRPLLLLQKISGGWIHRPLNTTNEKCQHYAFQSYCIFWELITIGALIRSVFILKDNLSINESMLIIMQVSFYIAIGISQIASFVKYKKVISFWDGIVHISPQKFNNHLKWQKVTIWVIIITSICAMPAIYSGGFYLILRSEPKAAYLKLADPWSGNSMEASIAYAITSICFLPPCGTWIGAFLLLIVAAYYLRRGFKDLHSFMSDDTQLINQLALHKLQYLRLSQLVEDLDDILWGYTGASMAMCTFDMCFIISALHGSHKPYEIIFSVALLMSLLITMGLIVVPSISINTWVS